MGHPEQEFPRWLRWLRDQLAAIEGVTSVTIVEEPSGAHAIAVTLGPTATRPAPATMQEGLRSLVDRNLVPMLVVDSETLDILYINELALRMLGYAAGDLARSTIADVIASHEVERLGRRLSETRPGWVDEGDWALTTRDGGEILVHKWSGPTAEPTHRLVIATAS